MARIESLLSARLFLVPQLVGNRLYFISNLSGHLSLYVMDHGGSVPEPLLPPHLALQNPHLLDGYSYYVFDKLGKIVVMLDKDGDENYHPMSIPLEGGYPEPVFGDQLDGYKAYFLDADKDHNLIYLACPSHSEPVNIAYRGNVETGELLELGRGAHGPWAVGFSPDHRQAALIEGYTVGDNVLYLWQEGRSENTLLYGKPLEQRAEGEQVPLNGIGRCYFTASGGLLLETALFEDTRGLGYLKLDTPQEIKPVAISGVVHQGLGEMVDFEHMAGDRFTVAYNIDGVSWRYEGVFDEDALTMTLDVVLCGQGEIGNGVLESLNYDKDTGRHAISYSTATSPTQLYSIEGDEHTVICHTNERILGLPSELLSSGEDASYTSFDGLRISARLYLPNDSLGFTGPRPLVYYVHGGPQSQERPDFAWFSIPLIQFLTLKGFAVFVPNVRGSTGYGLSYTKHVDRDWGGKDRLDHVHAMTEVLPNDSRVDTSRAAVVGRSYGGYMTLTLAGRHPELWSAAVDMFGPYDLFTFLERMPETWKPYFYIAIGHPEKDKEWLTDRSPRTHIDNLACPMMVIQGKNDPRVVEAESADLVEHLRNQGKQIEYLMFEDEGHDVLKFKNRVTVYNAITDFFTEHLKP